MVKDFKLVDDDIYLNPITGDFELVDSDNQHVKDICNAYPGWYKGSPSTGAGLTSSLKGKVTVASVETIIKSQLEADGYQLNRPEVTINPDGSFRIKPNAVRK